MRKCNLHACMQADRQAEIQKCRKTDTEGHGSRVDSLPIYIALYYSIIYNFTPPPPVAHDWVIKGLGLVIARPVPQEEPCHLAWKSMALCPGGGCSGHHHACGFRCFLGFLFHTNKYELAITNA